MNYDVIIVGGGPAGSAVSTLLARGGFRALLLEKSRFPREKVCGEFIAPECLRVFDRLGVTERMFDAGAKIIDQMTLFAPDGRSVDVPMEWLADGRESRKHAIGISRARMDTILFDQARAAGVDAREGFQVSPRLGRESRMIFIEGKADGETVERFYAPLVIDASGIGGVLSNQALRRKSRLGGSRLFGCKVHLRGVERVRGGGELFFFRDGYGGLSDVEDDRSNLCFMATEAALREAKGDREKLLDLTMRSNPVARRRLRDAVICGEWVGIGPIAYGRRRHAPGVISIGDAGAFIDPFTGSGITLALKSAELAAEVIRQALSEGVRDADAIAERYDHLHRARFAQRFRACALLRVAAFNSMARNALVYVLTRHRSLVKLTVMSVR